jgi:hypothetical protein
VKDVDREYALDESRRLSEEDSEIASRAGGARFLWPPHDVPPTAADHEFDRACHLAAQRQTALEDCLESLRRQSRAASPVVFCRDSTYLAGTGHWRRSPALAARFTAAQASSLVACFPELLHPEDMRTIADESLPV